MTEINTSNIINREHQDVVTELLEVQNRNVLDIGCGNGHLTRFMTKLGAKVIGIDPETRQLQRAYKNLIGSECYLQGTAEKLPIGNDIAHIVVFFNSLHHVPVSHLGVALNEAHRTLKHKGVLYISEPLAKGPLFELSKPFNDETIVREEAYKAIRQVLNTDFVEEKEVFYTTDIFYKDFRTYRENSISINPERENYFRAAGDNFQTLFEQHGEKAEYGWCFPQIIRVNKLKIR